jgi:(p)ppGpp synthase/HD superfamily hydrolase
MSDLQRAIEIAVLAHKGQSRKNGDPYILHPLRLMHAVPSTREKIVAVLHDVVEDTSVTMDQLKSEGFSPEILDALALVTHDGNEPYDEYINNIKTNPIARSVKLADLRDNSNLHEIPELNDKDLARVKKYHRAFKSLSQQSTNETNVG